MVLSYSDMSMSLPSSNTILSAAASLTASLILLRSITNDVVPQAVQSYASSSVSRLSSYLSSQLTLIIEDSDGIAPNHLFHSASLYLATTVSSSTLRIKVTKPEQDQDFSLSVDKNQEIRDSFKGSTLKWLLRTSLHFDADSKKELRFFELTFHKKFRERVLKEYLPYVIAKAADIQNQVKAVKLHTVDYNGQDYWGSVVLNHPATFQTMAMDEETKAVLVQDLDRFVDRKEYYKRVGKAWKRGYLLYGPPGTGKSSLVAAMANYLKFDVYDLDLSEVQCNSDLRRLLIGTKNRSILVIEDIDCNVGVVNREAGDAKPEDDKITLSGLLNFIDGLWSSCGDERIIVFTTNHKDRLDPALLRPGRMDIHIEMSYCSFDGFKVLASNYLKVKDHTLFKNIERLLSQVQVTPAEVAGELMKNDDGETSLFNLVNVLESKEKI